MALLPLIDVRGIKPCQAPCVVLVVEDDPLQRMLAVEIVKNANFVAIEACDADEAVTLLESRSDVALLFTDIEMPGSMDGLQLAHTARHRWPKIKIIVVSGRDQKSIPSLPSESCFIQKPYLRTRMIAELHAMVGPDLRQVAARPLIVQN
jgi:two-component system, response regulator PdtaR